MNDFYFYGSKIAWLILSPINLIFLVTAIGVCLLWTKRHLLGRRIVTFMLIFIGLIFILPVDQWMMRPLENAHPQPDLGKFDKIDGIIVLGGEFNARISVDRNNATTSVGTERINAFIKLLKDYPDAKAAFSGGSGSIVPGGVTGASLARKYMEDLDIDVSRVVFEGQSRNTRENAIYMKKLMQPKPDENWILITSAFHMPRSVREFQKQDWEPIPYPVGYRTTKKTRYFTGDIRLTVYNLITATREWLATLRP